MWVGDKFCFPALLSSTYPLPLTLTPDNATVGRLSHLYPNSAFLILTTDCNLTCEYCFYAIEPERKIQGKLTWPSVARIIKELRLLGVTSLYLTGGEPLLQEDIHFIIKLASDMAMETYLLSNGKLLNKEKINLLEKSGLEHFIFSLDDLNNEVLDIIENRLTLFKKATVSLTFVITKKNYQTVRKIYNLAVEHNFGIIFQPVYIPMECEHTPKSPLERGLRGVSQIRHLLEQSVSLRSLTLFDWVYLDTLIEPWTKKFDSQDYYALIRAFYTDKKIMPSVCPLAGNALVIDVDGEVYPCFHRRDLQCGNFLSEDFAQILTKLKNNYKFIEDAKCFGEHCISLFVNYKLEDVDGEL